MKRSTFIASAAMGLESVVRDECVDLGFDNVTAYNGRVEFSGDEKDLANANMWLRCADRVFIKMGEFKALSFDDLFNKINALPWEDIIDPLGSFPISWVSSVKSKLYSKSDIQRICKKSIVERLKDKLKVSTLPETGASYAIKIQAHNDIFVVMIDTSGEPLHKRGYRALINEAPLKETMAAALIKISRWKGGDRPLLDPMCGTGTIAIEGAMIARNIAPGSLRHFAAEKWPSSDENIWIDARDEAYSKENTDTKIIIYASDIDADAISIAKKNSEKAGVSDDIIFECKNFLDMEPKESQGSLIVNPPYGERLADDTSIERLYRLFGDVCRMRIPKWSYYIITASENFEKIFGKKATKNRKLYNGGIKCYYYQYYGEKKRTENGEK